jgi:hypothetical protein
MAGKPSWDQANRRQKLGLVWRIRNKISQIIKDYFYLPFFLLIILWTHLIPLITIFKKFNGIAVKNKTDAMLKAILLQSCGARLKETRMKPDRYDVS